MEVLMLVMEVKDEVRPEVPFRSITDLKGYLDYERIEDEGLVDQDYESLSSIIARMQRGESVASRNDYYYESDMDDGDLFESMNPLESPDADLADASALMDSIQGNTNVGGQGEDVPPATSPDKAIEPSSDGGALE
ncbi:hypothetical protein [Tortoise microvirus 34]|nr:hypothetical protein [Tortoise microvirus 34]